MTAQIKEQNLAEDGLPKEFDVYAYTENGRQIRDFGTHFEVQPQHDNYWIQCRTANAALRAYYHPETRKHNKLPGLRRASCKTVSN